MSKLCQSCGLPLKKDPQRGGTNSDGSASSLYCSYCFRDGKFLLVDINVTEMQQICITKMKEKGMPGWLAWLFTRNLPLLKRWKGGAS